jgi:hypothetical protein
MRFTMSFRRELETPEPMADCRAEPRKGFFPTEPVPEKVRFCWVPEILKMKGRGAKWLERRTLYPAALYRAQHSQPQYCYVLHSNP